MERTRAVEDYEHIRKRLEELRREVESERRNSDHHAPEGESTKWCG